MEDVMTFATFHEARDYAWIRGFPAWRVNERYSPRDLKADSEDMVWVIEAVPALRVQWVRNDGSVR